MKNIENYNPITIQKLPQDKRDYQILLWGFKEAYGNNVQKYVDMTFCSTDINQVIAELENPLYGDDCFKVDAYFENIWSDIANRIGASIETADDGDYWFEYTDTSRINVTVQRVYNTIQKKLHNFTHLIN